MSKKTTNPSIQNIALLLCLGIGLFILYRYIKNVELTCKKETCTLGTTIECLQKEMDNFKKQNAEIKTSFITQDEDTFSIQSADITSMLKKVMCVADDMEDDLTVDESTVDKCTIEILEDSVKEDECAEDSAKEDECVEDSAKEDECVEDLDYSSELMKKTNKDLKQMCVDLGISNKGNKNELVERIMSNMI